MMRGPAIRAARWAAIFGAAAAAVAIVRPGQRDLVLDAYVLLLGALALAVLVAATRAAAPVRRESAFAKALTPGPTRSARPADLEDVERNVLLASAGAFDVHYRLRPALRGIATHRLSLRRGIDLDADPEAARAVLGPEAWELVRPDRERPADRLGSGLPLARLDEAVAALERL